MADQSHEQAQSGKHLQAIVKEGLREFFIEIMKRNSTPYIRRSDIRSRSVCESAGDVETGI